MSAAAISDRNSRSPRVVGMPSTPTRSTSGWCNASTIITMSVNASAAKNSAVAGVHAIQAMPSMAPSLDPAERETARDVVADKPDHERARQHRQHSGGGKQAPVHA